MPIGTIIHEYELNEMGDGIFMRSTFTLPSLGDGAQTDLTDPLAQHALEEMQFLPNFLPVFFQDEYVGGE